MILGFKDSIFCQMFKNNEIRSLVLLCERKEIDEMEVEDIKGKF